MDPTLTSKELRAAFALQPLQLARVVQDGFEIDGEIRSELEGFPERAHLVRKRFEKRRLVCDSKDGEFARDGTLCQSCLHPRCRPWLRLYVRGEHERYLLDLDSGAARSFFDLEDLAREAGEELTRWKLRLSVRNRGTYGQVTFSRL